MSIEPPYPDKLILEDCKDLNYLKPVRRAVEPLCPFVEFLSETLEGHNIVITEEIWRKFDAKITFYKPKIELV